MTGDLDSTRARILKNLLPLSEWPQRAIMFGKHISSASPETASVLFAGVCMRVAGVRDPDSVVLAQSAFLSLLFGHWDEEHLIHTREAAAGQGDDVTLAFLVPTVYPDENEEEFEIPKYSAERPLTLGERKSLASVPSRQKIERAMSDPHPMVARKLLDNPKITEDDVVRICAKRLMPPSVLAQVSIHTKWRERRMVQRALVNNRALPVCFSLSLIPFLDMRSIREISFDRRLHEEVREAAYCLIHEITRNREEG